MGWYVLIYVYFHGVICAYICIFPWGDMCLYMHISMGWYVLIYVYLHGVICAYICIFPWGDMCLYMYIYMGWYVICVINRIPWYILQQWLAKNNASLYQKHIDSIFSLGYLPLITKPTRIANTSATLLDHIYSNSINDQTINGIVLSDVSDHFGIVHLETSYLKKQLQTPMLKKTYYEINIDKLNSMLTATNFQDVLDMS